MGIDLLHVASHVELEELHLYVVARVLVRIGPWWVKGLSLPALQIIPGGGAPAETVGVGRRLAAEPGVSPS